MIPAPDGYQYGVRCDHDGSVLAYWNGRTQRAMAEIKAAQLKALYPKDQFTVVCRIPVPGMEWLTVSFRDETRRAARLLGPTDEAVRDMAVARATVRPRNECPHCHPEG